MWCLVCIQQSIVSIWVWRTLSRYDKGLLKGVNNPKLTMFYLQFLFYCQLFKAWVCACAVGAGCTCAKQRINNGSPTRWHLGWTKTAVPSPSLSLSLSLLLPSIPDHSHVFLQGYFSQLILFLPFNPAAITATMPSEGSQKQAQIY